MKRRPTTKARDASREAETLARLAQGLSESGSRIEDAYWEGALSGRIRTLLHAGQDAPIIQALDILQNTSMPAYDEFADLVESLTEGGTLEPPTGTASVLLIALPVLVWSRYAIASRTLPAQALVDLRVQLAAHVLAADARIALADYLFSPDQLPPGHCETHKIAQSLWQHALDGVDLHIEPRDLPEAGQYVSDVRYVLGALSIPFGHPVFRWNEVDGDRDIALAQWQKQAGPILQNALTGCQIELVLPDGYFAAWRRADREGRPHALRAAVGYLQAMLNIPASGLSAVVAPYQEGPLAEWRIGFSQTGSSTVLHGVVWPLLLEEDENSDTARDIEAVLREAGLADVRVLEHALPLDYCDDCGMALFPTRDAESVHPEMPIVDDTVPTHLH